MTTAQSGKPEADAATPPSVARGAAVIARSLRTLTGSAGIYRMNGADGKPLYIGKARNLKRRVAAYTRPERMPTRLQRMIAATQGVEVITTHTEVEALLLESNLIKRLKPRYNVMCYEELVADVRDMVGAGHVNLVETLAERIADLCLARTTVRCARVRVEKLDVFADAVSVGVEIERSVPSQ